jgi:hypothetical protein
LRDVAGREKASAQFRTRLAKLLGRYTSRRALFERVTRSKLIKSTTAAVDSVSHLLLSSNDW